MRKSAAIQFVKRVCTLSLHFAYTFKYFFIFFLGSKNLHMQTAKNKVQTRFTNCIAADFL